MGIGVRGMNSEGQFWRFFMGEELGAKEKGSRYYYVDHLLIFAKLLENDLSFKFFVSLCVFSCFILLITSIRLIAQKSVYFSLKWYTNNS